MSASRPCPVQSSSQNLKSVPPRSLGRKKDRTRGKISRRPAMTRESPRRGVAHTSQSNVDPYDSWSKWDIKSSKGCITRVTHLHSKAELACWRWCMPSPPSAKGRHTELQATRAPPLPRSAPRQKILRMALSMGRRTPAAIRKADMKYVGMAERTAFTRTRRPPRDNSFPRQPPRRFSTFSTTGCQS